jgi:hypothetical protein
VPDGNSGAQAASVTASTGLGLPLSREFANISHGWLGLEDDASAVTHFWCVVPGVLSASGVPCADSQSLPSTNPETTIPSPAMQLQSLHSIGSIVVSPAAAGAAVATLSMQRVLPQALAASSRVLPESVVVAMPAADYSQLRVIVVDGAFSFIILRVFCVARIPGTGLSISMEQYKIHGLQISTRIDLSSGGFLHTTMQTNTTPR